MAEKVVNYTDAQVETLKAGYDPSAAADTRKAQVIALAETLGKSTKSIVAKLVRMGVYVSAEYVSKTGEKPIKKDTVADAIGKVLNLSEPETDSLTKANKGALDKVFKALANSIPREVESNDAEKTKAENAKVLARVAGLTDDESRSLTRLNSAVLGKLAAVFADEDTD